MRIALCNRSGREDQMNFIGYSLAIDPHGNVISGAGTEEELLTAELDLTLIDRSRKMRPYLALRRPEFY